MKLKYLESNVFEEMKELFRDVFSSDPWFDKWDNEAQLDAYLKDLTDNTNSLSLALYDERHELIGCSLGYMLIGGKEESTLLRNFLSLETNRTKARVALFCI
ncbi:hypothetical protein ACE1TH_11085 [Shouchella sp. JSM 1781072]|uniref:hypothetical protein n=1 Tax=Bacillaceae TaxID=186817 RepID=UPI0021000040|nr:hypothetical protein [Bacillus sp. Marseille-P3800]